MNLLNFPENKFRVPRAKACRPHDNESSLLYSTLASNRTRTTISPVPLQLRELLELSSARSPTSRMARCRYFRETLSTDRQRSRRPSFSGAYDGVPERSSALAIAGPFSPYPAYCRFALYSICLSSPNYEDLARFFEFPRVRDIVNARG